MECTSTTPRRPHHESQHHGRPIRQHQVSTQETGSRVKSSTPHDTHSTTQQTVPQTVQPPAQATRKEAKQSERERSWPQEGDQREGHEQPNTKNTSTTQSDRRPEQQGQTKPNQTETKSRSTSIPALPPPLPHTKKPSTGPQRRQWTRPQQRAPGEVEPPWAPAGTGRRTPTTHGGARPSNPGSCCRALQARGRAP